MTARANAWAMDGMKKRAVCCGHAALMLTALFAAAGCAPQQKVDYQQVHAVVGMGEAEVRAKLGMPSFLTDGGESQWWTYDDVVGPDGKGSVSCHVIFKAGKVDKVDC